MKEYFADFNGPWSGRRTKRLLVASVGGIWEHDERRFEMPGCREFPEIGERVLLIDGEGNQCEADVREIPKAKMVFYTQPDMTTWKDGP